jgi:hypothetical protein
VLGHSLYFQGVVWVNRHMFVAPGAADYAVLEDFCAYEDGGWGQSCYGRAGRATSEIEMIQLSSEVVVSPALPDSHGPRGIHNGGVGCPVPPDGRGTLGVRDVSWYTGRVYVMLRLNLRDVRCWRPSETWW